MIYVTGDIHSNPERFNTHIFPEQKEMTKDDYVIILGDFGLVLAQKEESPKEAYWLDWLEKKPFTTLFVDGNHENFDRLDAYPVEEWNGGKVHKLRPSVIHLMRGQVFSFHNSTFFAFGGATSHDIGSGLFELDDPNLKLKIKRLERNHQYDYRIKHFDWWERELPNESEMVEGLANLEKHNHKVDFILTHSPSTSLLEELDVGAGEYKRDSLTDYLQEVCEMTCYRYHLFGHMHLEKMFPAKKAACLYHQITRIR